MPVPRIAPMLRLTQTDLNDLIVRYNIPRDLHLRLPSPDLVMYELLNDAIGFYHYFSSHCAPSLVCIDDNRHPSSAIDDPKPPTGSYSREDVRRLSAHIVKLRDMLDRVSVFMIFYACPSGTGLRFKRSLIMILDPLYKGSLSTAPTATINATIPDPTLEDLATSTPITKSSRSTSRSNLFVGDDDEEIDDDDDDACVEIPLITPIHSYATIPTGRNQGGGSAPPFAEGPSTQGKAVMSDVTDASSGGDFFPFTPRPYYATYPVDGVVASSYKVSQEELDGPHQPTLTIFTKDIFNDPSICKIVVDQFLTPREMVRIEDLTDDQLVAKMSVLHCVMMSHVGELLARYGFFLKYHHDYVQFADSQLRSLQDRCTAYQGLESQVFGFQKQVTDLNDKFSSSDAAFVKAKAKGKDRKKKIKSLSQNVDQLTTKFARLSSTLNQATILEVEKDVEILRLRASPPKFASFFQDGFQSLVRKFLASDEFSRVQDRLAEASPFVAITDYPFLKKISDYATHPLFAILQLELEKLAHPEVVPPLKTARVSHLLTKELTVTLASSSLKFPSNVVPSSFATVVEQPFVEHNEEWVDMLDIKMVDAAINERVEVFVPSVAYPVSENVVQVEPSLVHGPELASSSPSDVVVALSIKEKENGSPRPSNDPITASADAEKLLLSLLEFSLMM
ncbi:hypothetical protein Tco_1160624 [Tanacetum coccineum]